MRRPPLQYWVPALLGLLTLSLTTVALVHDWLRSTKEVERSLRRRTMAVGHLVVPALEQALGRSESSKVEAELARLILVPGLSRVAVLDAQDRILAQSGKDEQGDRIDVRLGESALQWVAQVRQSRTVQWDIPKGGRVLRASFPLLTDLSSGQTQTMPGATLYVEADLVEPKRAEWSGILQRTLAMGLVALVCCLGAAWYFHRSFTDPLNRLLGEVDAYATARRVLEMPGEGKGELARLERALNRMTRDLAEQESALREGEARKAAILESTVEALRRKDLLLRQVIDLVPHFIFAKDREGRFIFVNRTAADALGMTPEALVGKSEADLPREQAESEVFRPDDWGSFDDGRHRLVRSETLVDIQGRRRVLQTVKIPFEDPGTRDQALLGVSVDITDRVAAEVAVHREVAFRSAIIERASEGICVCHAIAEPPYVVFTVWNERMTEITGYTLSEINRQGWHVTMYPDPVERARAEERMVRMREGDDLVNEEWEVTRADGCRRTFAISTRVLEAPGGEHHVLALMRDMTEKKLADEALRASEERFRELAESIHEVFWVANADNSRVLYVSPAYERIWGRPISELVENPRAWFEALHPDDRVEYREVMLTGNGNKPWDATYRILRPDGEVRWIHDRGFPVRDERGQLVRMVGVAEDVTAKMHAELEKARLTTAMEQAAEAILVTDVRGVIQYVNPAFERVTGYSRQEAVGRTPGILKSGNHDVSFYADLRATLQRGDTWKGRFINRRRDGQLFELEASISPVRDSTGRVVNYFEIARDITREVQLEVQLRHAQKMDAIGQLAGGVAHDFNNLLAVITLQIDQIVQAANLPADAVEAVKEIRSATDRAIGLTRQLLLFGRRQVLQPRVVDLRDVVANLKRLLDRIIGADIQFEVRDGSQPVLIFADAGMLDQVLLNLVVNARDAMPRGGKLTLEMQVRSVVPGDFGAPADAEPGHYACLRVVDTGIGMTADVLPHIFEPFFTTKRVGEGTGLGLATVFGIVKQHQGWIQVSSVPDQGSVFEVFLPLTNRDVAKPAPAPVRRIGGGAGETVMVVEDDPNVRKATTRVLERNGYRVISAPDGVAALDAWPEVKDGVQLLLTDVVMPGGVSGHELARRLREVRPELKVIFMSGYDAERAGGTFESHSRERFLQKPVSVEDLLEAVRTVLSG